ncbi:site-specific integrase [Pseudoxanthomonas jiangsuensis]|uniref:site-specific integrase n=1 Tax=Pseudoxanthomonas jiangsuensis TaxID=619688 RepID=UPI001B86F855|nr:site-specific integrase [Pseudoxanthomonas jiangsuensis]
MATLRKKPWGWEAQIRLRGRPSVSATFGSKADARAWAADTESQIARGVYRERGNDARLTLGLLIERYLVEVTPHKKGAAVEAVRLALIQRDPICQIRLSDYLQGDMAAYRDRRLAVVSGSTVNRELNLISHVFNIGRKEWGVKMDNPVQRLRRPKENRARSRRLAPAEEAALLHELRPSERDDRGVYRPGGCRNTWILPLVRLALATAMRQGELLSLRWQDVDLAGKCARLHDTKNGESRDVPLSTQARSILAGLPRDGSGRVFPTTSEAVKQSFSRATERAGLVDFHFHDLRHEAVSRMAPLIRDSLTLSKVTGHKSTRMLGRYFHPDASYMAGLLDGGPEEAGGTPNAPTAASQTPDLGSILAMGQQGEGSVDVVNVLEHLLRQLKPAAQSAP